MVLKFLARASRVALLLVALTVSVPAQAQQSAVYTLVLRGVNAQEALDRFASVTKSDLLYDADLILGRPAVYCALQDVEPDEILRCITKQADLDFVVTSSGTYVIVERSAEAPAYGTVSGAVVDAATGDPLANANVYLEEAGVGAAANEAGFFSISGLLPGRHTVIASYVGYQPTANIVNLLPGDLTRAKVELVSEPIRYAPVVVDGLTQRLTSERLGRGEVDAVVSASAGGVGPVDVVRSVSSIVGVGSANPFEALGIQGGGSSDHAITLDGAPVFYPRALGNLVGAFSPLAIGRVTAHKAGFGARVGSQLSGVIALEHDTQLDGKSELMAQVDPLSASILSKVRIGEGTRSATVMLSGRTSLWDVYRAGALDGVLTDWNVTDPALKATLAGSTPAETRFVPVSTTPAVSFQDLHFASKMRLSPFRSASVSAYYGMSDFRSTSLSEGISDASYVAADDDYRWTNFVASARHNWILGARALVGVKASYSSHSMEHGFQSLDSTLAVGPSQPLEEIESLLFGALPGARLNVDRNDVRHGSVGLSIEYSPSATHQLGLDLEQVFESTDFVQDSEYFASVSSAYRSSRTVLAVVDRWQAGSNIVVDGGLRANYVDQSGSVYVEPRAAIRGDKTLPNGGTVAARLSGGVYRQFVSPFDLSSVAPSALLPSVRFWIPTQRDLAPARSEHFALDVTYFGGERWRVVSEFFYKNQPRILSIDYGTIINQSLAVTDQEDFVEAASGRSVGFALSTEYDGGIVKAKASYERTDAQRTFPSLFGDRQVQSPWNQPHRFETGVRLMPAAGLELRARWVNSWGSGWAFRQAYYDFLAAHNSALAFPPFNLSDPDSHRLPAYSQVDAGATYRQTVGRVPITFRIDVLNVMNASNVVDWTVSPSVGGSSYDVQERFLPGIQAVASVQVGL